MAVAPVLWLATLVLSGSLSTGVSLAAHLAARHFAVIAGASTVSALCARRVGAVGVPCHGPWVAGAGGCWLDGASLLAAVLQAVEAVALLRAPSCVVSSVSPPPSPRGRALADS